MNGIAEITKGHHTRSLLSDQPKRCSNSLIKTLVVDRPVQKSISWFCDGIGAVWVSRFGRMPIL